MTVQQKEEPLQRPMGQLLSLLKVHPSAEAFLDPVSAEDVPDYHQVISQPMDLGTLSARLTSYKGPEDFIQDLKQVFLNCFTYNSRGSPVHSQGLALLNFALDQTASLLPSQYGLLQQAQPKRPTKPVPDYVLNGDGVPPEPSPVEPLRPKKMHPKKDYLNKQHLPVDHELSDLQSSL